ncbi:hypothetical protein EUGRSUZ_I00427 [Eucalyptus grandis]|uniref:Uncharacterized protein n=2 Tax=Eucalyptus grandis TaxID=71139 RepID=A0ACC3JBS9_EUCGR|nr:hypothetical protein EUGRSUZ_I00427 [Eucalyptus grandis]
MSIMCRPLHKGYDDLTSSSHSFGLSSTIYSGFQTQCHVPPVSAFSKAHLSFKRIRGMSSAGKVLRFALN